MNMFGNTGRRLAARVFLFFVLLTLGGLSGRALATNFQAAGAAVGSVNAVTPLWPAHLAGDVALLFVESTGGQAVTLSTPNGFAAVPDSPQFVGTGVNGTRLSVFWARATSGAMPAPTVADPGDHVYARILTYRGVPLLGNPWDVTGGGIRSLALALDSVTTTVGNTRVVQIASRGDDSTAAGFSAQTNASLTGIVERFDAGTTAGNGGGIALWDGLKATAGATGITTATVTAAASADNAYLTVALRGQAGPRYQAAGAARDGTGAVSPPWPAHVIGDVALLFVESAGGEAVSLSTPAGFLPVVATPQATGAGATGTRLTVFWARATSAVMPTPTVADPGDHVYARILTYRGVIAAGNPWHIVAGGVKAAASTSVATGGVTTTIANTLVVEAASRDNDSNAAAFSAQTNATLGTITERSDGGTTRGNGGGFAVWDGFKATAGGTGGTTATVANSVNAFVTIALAPDGGSAPFYQALGAQRSGTGAVTPPWPAHAANDLALLVVESAGGQAVTLSTPAGFAPVSGSPQAVGAGAAGTRLSVFWARATSAAMAAPTVADPGDHVYARIVTYRGVVNSGNPWDVTGGGARTNTGVVLSSVTTTVPALVVQAVSRDNDAAGDFFSAQTNASLSGIAERSDAGTTAGNGGGFAVWDGTLGTAGPTGNTTVTVIPTNNAYLTIALRGSGPHHYELAVPASSVTCLPTSVTVTACADATNPCTSIATGVNGTVDLAATNGATIGQATLAAGVGAASLSHPAAANGTVVTVSQTGASVPASNPATCLGGSCATTFNTAGFVFSASAGGGVATVPAQVAGVSSATHYLRAVRTGATTQACEAALTGATSVDFAHECTDPGVCYTANLMSVNGGASTTIARNNGGSVSSYTAVNLTFDANGNAPLTFNYADAGQVRLHARKLAGGALLSPLSGQTNAFIVKPFDFLVTPCAASVVGDCATPPPDPGIAGGGDAFARAGENFKATVTARTATGTATPSFGLGSNNGVETVDLTHVRVAPIAAGAVDGVLSGTVAIPRSAFSGGIATVSDLTWNEVGVIRLNAASVSFLGSIMATSGSSANLGRFTPYHLDSAVTPVGGVPTACPTGLACPILFNGLAYSGQPFTVQVTARNFAGSTTANYFSGYARDVTLTAWDALGSTTTQNPSGALAGGSVAATAFAAGIGSAATPTYTLAAVNTPPTDIYFRAIDTDAISSLRTVPATSVEGGVKVAKARARVGNAFGSEKANLPLPAVVEYWNGSFWRVNDQDGASALTLPTITNTSGTGVVTYTASSAFTAGGGNFGLVLTSTGPASVTLGYTVADWLRYPWAGGATMLSPSATASFGLYPGSKRFIYRREVR